MSVRSVRDGICRYFGGPYDPPTRTYPSPQIPNLSTVRRAFPKREDEAEFSNNQEPGSGLGCVMVVWVLDGDERRIAVAGPVDGRKQVTHAIQFHCFVRCRTPYAEDGQDYVDDLLDQVRDHIHADRTCGSGGFEVGGFQVGEGESPKFSWHLEQGNTSEDVTDFYLLISTDAVEIVAA